MSTLENNRPNPDELLASIKQKEETTKRGKLKIFFGMSPGVGKTYAMLQTAQMDMSKGVDVVIGYVEPHNRPETNALLDGFEIIPRKQIDYKGTQLEEMDLDAVIRRHPYLVLVDELAHTNAEGSRHAKRYQDVVELLDNGINVYTTVNIQHLESKTDTITQITGITVKETLPDEIFELADDIELIDITPTTLLERLAEGKIYSTEQSKKAALNFFRKGNITALREMSLRLVAERVDKQLKCYMQEKRISGPWKSGLHLLVLIGPSKSSAKLIRWAKNLTDTMGADLIALHVENTQVLDEEQSEQLSKNINLARQFGAEILVTSGSDVISATLEVARRENVTHIVIGKSGKQSFLSSLFSKGNGDFVSQLLKRCGDIDVYVIEPGFEAKQYKKKLVSLPDFSSPIKEYIFAAVIILLTCLLCRPIAGDIGYQSVSFILLFVVSMLALFLRVGPILLASAMSAFLWNYFFIAPIHTPHISKMEDILTLCMFFIIAFVSGILTAKTRRQERLTRNREEKTNALYRLTKHLSQAENSKAIIEVAKEDIKKYFSIDVAFLLQDGNDRLSKEQFKIVTKSNSTSEFSVAQWVFKHSKKAGNFTDTLSACEYTYYPLKGAQIKPGIVIVKLNKPLKGEMELFWETFITQISNALEHQFIAQMAQRASLLDESDKLYKTLFNSISHELRIPVATIMGASDTLIENTYPESVKIELYNEILTASKRLNRLIENLLNISRLESDRITPHIDWCDIRDLFNHVVTNLKDELEPFKVDIVVPESMPLVQIDFGLMEQALHNLLYNSAKYSPPQTTIRLKAFYDNEQLILQEMDRGSGFPVDALPYVFNKFYRVDSEKTGGLGLGLSIVKGFVEAHKGTISVENRQHGGARFTIKIPSNVSYSSNLIAENYE
jgi:two-component system sensor histidine kinase KdpD